jgi:hypothetical protein
MEKPAFDLEQVYDEKINPLMAQIITICKDNDLPFVASFQMNSDGDFCSSALLPENRPVDPMLERLFGVLRPPRASMMMLTTKDKDGNTEMTAIVP